ncbi:aminotransferase-like domain-containing protein [Streptomyces melanosporofaciens]|uniref:aminotransferase-like domain-containing protein n=1 Tax=unclassified Streptomyces TaxID=2593676 RepID=UPI00369B8F94
MHSLIITMRADPTDQSEPADTPARALRARTSGTRPFSGVHGTLHPSDMRIPLVLHGSAFTSRTRRAEPAGPVDAAATGYKIVTGAALDDVDGRVLTESLREVTDSPRFHRHPTSRSQPSVTTPITSDHNPDDLRRREDPVFMSGNLPPDVPEVFDTQYGAALDAVLTGRSPSRLIGAHQYRGSDRDRAAGAAFTARRLGAAPAPERVVVANGTQSILTQLLSRLVPRGGVLAVEELTYPTIRTFVSMLGIGLAPVAMDGEGIDPDAFERICRTQRPAALYTMPTLQNPTTGTMGGDRRRAIAEVCRRHGVSVIEDDIYSLLPTDAPRPLSAYLPELSWYVLGTAKSIAPGLKVAYVVAPDEESAKARFWPGVRSTYWMVAPINAAVTTRLVEDDGATAIIDAVRAETRARHELVTAALSGIGHRTTPESLHVWLPVPPGRTAADFASATLAAGASIGTSGTFYVGADTAPETVRIGVGAPPDRGALQRGLTAVRHAYHQ